MDKRNPHEKAKAETGETMKVSEEKALIPWVTYVMLGVCVALFIGFLLLDDAGSWESYARLGHLPANAIWDGAYWALISSAFVHVAIWHLGFNTYWLWVLGRSLEREIGSWRYLGFVLTAAFVSSSFQLAVSDGTGIGASGIVYAIFGFMWLSRQQYPKFKEMMDGQTILLFVGWLLGCIMVTWMQVWSIGNAAHVSGLFFGFLVAGSFVLSRKVKLVRVALAAFLCLSFLPLFCCPWSITWWSFGTYKAHVAGRLDVALDGYSYIIEKWPGNAWAYENRSLVYESLGHQQQAEADYQRACELDPSVKGEAFE